MTKSRKQNVRTRPPSSAPAKGVLSDHTKRGKKLIPPYVEILGRPKNVSWIDTIIPEVIWIGLLHEAYGQAEGTTLALNLARSADNAKSKKGAPFFAAASDFVHLTREEKTVIIEDLGSSEQLVLLQRAFLPLVRFYPTCPFNFLSSQEDVVESAVALDCLKRVLLDLFDKETKRTVFVQATVVYLAFVLDRLKVVEGLTLARFPEVENYPNTEISRRVARAIRPTVLSLLGPSPDSIQSTWPTEFWNRGLAIDSCVTG